MKAALSVLFKTPGFLWRALVHYRSETGQALSAWLLLVLANGAVQVIFKRQLAPGEFATLNTLLGAVGLFLVPIVAVQQALSTFPQPGLTPERLEKFRQGTLPLVQNSALLWLVPGTILFLGGLHFLYLPRFVLGLLALGNIYVMLGSAMGAALFQQENKLRRWALLLLVAGLVRFLSGLLLTASEPWAEAALGASLCGGFVLLTPVLRQTTLPLGWTKMTAILRDREFRRHLGATASVVLGIFIFTNADRIVAQGWFGRSTDNNLGLVRWNLFDGYQAAGLLGRAVLWGTQPILALLLVRRLRLARTGGETVALAGVYLAAVVIGAVLLDLLTLPLSRLFGGEDPASTAYFIPGFATAIIPLALLQGLGIFVLATRRHPECWCFALCSLIYAIFLLREGKPQVMLTSMFSGGGVTLLAMLLVLVVRWGRKQP